MTDTLSKAQRSRCMSRIPSRGTTPENTVASILDELGLKFDQQRQDLPGTPDFVLPDHSVVIFVNGCFWHGHSCNRGRLPKSRRTYWKNKVDGNRRRDRRVRRQLRALGWQTMTIWQCHLKRLESVQNRLIKFS